MPTDNYYTYAVPSAWNDSSSVLETFRDYYNGTRVSDLGSSISFKYTEPDVTADLIGRIAYLEHEVNTLRETVEVLLEKLRDAAKTGVFLNDMELADLLNL